MIVTPSILNADFLRLGETLDMLNQEGVCVLHLDVMDGHFVPNLTFGPPVIASMAGAFEGELEAHLMVQNPEELIGPIVEAGCGTVLVQLESSPHLHRLLQRIRAAGVRAGVVLNPATPLNGLEYVLDELDQVLLMTVNPGFGGQHYVPAMDTKIQQLNHLREGRDWKIEVDGGIKVEQLARLCEWGVDRVVMGSAIFAHDEPSRALREIQDVLRGLS